PTRPPGAAPTGRGRSPRRSIPRSAPPTAAPGRRPWTRPRPRGARPRRRWPAAASACGPSQPHLAPVPAGLAAARVVDVEELTPVQDVELDGLGADALRQVSGALEVARDHPGPHPHV